MSHDIACVSYSIYYMLLIATRINLPDHSGYRERLINPGHTL